MNYFRLILVAAVLCPFVGCKWMETHWGHKDGPKEKGKVEQVTPEQLVAYLNERANRLQSISKGDVRVTARDRNMAVSVPITLRGSLSASQPRNFRMIASATVDGKVDLGSNDQQFWVYAKVPTADAMFVYASHTDFEANRAPIPGNIPFEPEWVMQALGMAHFLPQAPRDPSPGTPTNQYTAKVDEAARTYTLSWPAVTPGRVSVIKEVVFDADTATGTRPQVKRHVVRDTAGKVICSAEIKEVKTVDAKTGQPVSTATPDPLTNQSLLVQYPTKIMLKWEQQKFEMELELSSAQINQPLAPEDTASQRKRPTNLGVTPINLADYRAPNK